MLVGTMQGFISYAHEDRRLVDALRQHLSVLPEVDHWTDQEILAGDRWEEKILAKLNDARLILLCISADFLWSRYIQRVELVTARERERRGECVVVPVVLRECLWTWKPELKDLQGVPRDGKAINLWKPRDGGYVDAVRAIGRRVKAMKTGGTP